MWPFAFHPTVHREVADGYDWYEGRQAGLGTDFLDALETVYGAIHANPARYPVVHADIREALLTRFPYAVYYRVVPSGVRILSVFHTVRNPSTWQRRV